MNYEDKARLVAEVIANSTPTTPTPPPGPHAPIKLIAASQLALYAIHDELCTWLAGRTTLIEGNIFFHSAQFIAHTFPVPGMLIGSTQAQLVVRDLYAKLEQSIPVGPYANQPPALITIPPNYSDIPGGSNVTIRHRHRDDRMHMSIRSQEVTYGVPADGYLHTVYIWFGWL